MRFGKAFLLLTLTVAAFLILSLKEHREALREWEATVADLRRQLVNARGEVAQLKAATHSSLDQEGQVHGEVTRISANERERAEMIILEVRDRVSGLQHEVQLARQEIERLRPQASTFGGAVPAADEGVADFKRELAEARESVTTLTRDLGHSQQEIQRLQQQGAAAVEQASKRAREREAALTRDLRAARRELQRANERLQIASQPDG